jgi:multidrug resistance efflux pump
MVAKGDIMVRLDDRQLRAQVEELKAREEWLKREHARVSELVKRSVATTQALERATSDLHQVQALISVQMEKLADYAIAAPMDGLVLRRDGEIGEIAEPGQILFRIGEPKPLQVVAEVNEEDIPRVEVSQTTRARTPSSARPTDRARMTPMGDPVAETYRIIALPDDAAQGQRASGQR